MAKTETIKIQDGNTIIELSGTDKEAFIADREATAQSTLLLEAEYKKKQEARKSALEKLAEIAGLTDEEINAII